MILHDRYNKATAFLNFAAIFGAIAILLAATAGAQTVGLACDPVPPLAILDDYQNIHDIVVIEEYIYMISEDRTLVILDLSDHLIPNVVKIIQFESVPTQLHLDNELLYVSFQESEVEVIDTSFPHHPVSLGPVTGINSLLAVKNGIAVAVLDEVMNIYDVSDRSNIAQLSSINDINNFSSALIFNESLIIGYRSQILFYDITNPIQPVLSSELLLPEPQVDLELNGMILYCAARSNGVYTIDIEDATNPLLINQVFTYGQAFNLAIHNHNLFIADHNAGIHVKAISAKGTLKYDGTLQTPGSLRAIHTTSQYILAPIENIGLVVYETGSWQSSLLSEDEPIHESRDIALIQNYAYLASWIKGLLLYDLSDMRNPTLIDTIPTFDAAVRAEVSGDYLYIADTFGGLIVFDINTPLLPVLSGWYSSMDFVTNFYIQDDLIYLTGAGRLDIVDISDPTFPRRLSSYNTSNTTAIQITAKESTIYLALAHEGVEIVNASDPFRPETVQQPAKIDWYVSGVFANNDYLYVIGNEFHIYNLIDAQNPVLIGEFILENVFFDNIATDGNLAYLTTDHGLVVLDISSPDQIRYIQLHPSTASNIRLFNDKLYQTRPNLRIYQANADCGSCLADLNLDGTLDFFDVSLFINYANTNNPLADINTDGLIDFFDIADFLDLYSSNCTTMHL